jgi:hypothetical protein
MDPIGHYGLWGGGFSFVVWMCNLQLSQQIPKKLCLERFLVQIMVVNMVPWTSCKPLGHSNLSIPCKKHRLGVGLRGLGNAWSWLEQSKKSGDGMATCTIG